MLIGAVQAYRDQFKREKKVSGVDECYLQYVDIWVREYPALGFNATSGRMLKSIIAQGRKWIKDGGKEDTRERVISLLEYVIVYVKKVDHFCHQKPLTTWNGQYLSIIAEISNGKRKSGTPTKSEQTRDFINDLKRTTR